MLRLKERRERKFARLPIRKLKVIFVKKKKKKRRDNLPSAQQQTQDEGLSSFCYLEFY